MRQWAKPVLRWAGSKRELLPQLTQFFRASAATGRYVEPFAGSACLFFSLRPGSAVLGDLNDELISTYRQLGKHPRQVARTMRRWKSDEATYYEVRAVDPDALDPVPRAARFLYLNRLCFNGVYRTNRAGRFNVPYGSKTGALPDEAHLYRCSVALRDAELRNGDFEATTADVKGGDFVYLDPPYTQDPRSAYGVYGYGSFDASDLDRVLATLRRIDDAGATFLFSYAAVDGLNEALRESWSLSEVGVSGRIAAAADCRRTRTEVLITNATPHHP